MFNFYALSPKEFVSLSRDILQKITGIPLKITDSANDQGGDIRDKMSHPFVAAQVKHYISSTPGQLMASLRKEVPKIAALSPAHYYLFLSKDLTAGRIQEILELFSGIAPFQEDDIYTLSRIDDLLCLPEYREILRRYPPLWNFSADMLGETVYQNIRFDSEEYLRMAEECLEFVPTEAYRVCLDVLDRKRMVLLKGSPGSGKTITSRMAALEYKRRGYRIIFSSDGSVKELKKAVHRDGSKELILLDDFLGQIYYTMDMGQARELEMLLSFIHFNENKCVILNSRITILQEALNQYRELDALLSGIVQVHTDGLTGLEKARILKNYLCKYMGDKPEILGYIAGGSRYLQILEHENFTPRMIRSVFLLRDWELSPEDFLEKFLNMLRHPDDIWKDEFENRLLAEDRILLTTLYSLADGRAEYDALEDCYLARITAVPSVDTTINQMEKVLGRLRQSMVKEILADKRYVEVLNPSVNDFLKDYISRNPLERRAILNSALYLDQIRKLFYEEYGSEKLELRALVEKMFQDRTIRKYRFIDQSLRGNVFLWCCVIREKLQEESYRESVIDILRTGEISHCDPYQIENEKDYLLPLFESPLAEFYGMGGLLREDAFLEAVVRDAGGRWTSVAPVLSAIWECMVRSGLDQYHLDLFRRIAQEAWLTAFYQDLKELDDFMAADGGYDWSDYETMIANVDDTMHPDDLIDYCEDEIYYFLDDDIRGQYERYAAAELEYRLTAARPGWMPESQAGKLRLNTDWLWSDRDCEKHVKYAVDEAMSRLVPEEAYDEYVGMEGESRYDMSLNQIYTGGYQEERKRMEEMEEVFRDLL